MVNRIPLFQTKTADTAHREFLQVKPGPFPDFWVGPGDEANMTKLRGKMATYRLFANCVVLGRCPTPDLDSSVVLWGPLYHLLFEIVDSHCMVTWKLSELLKWSVRLTAQRVSPVLCPDSTLSQRKQSGVQRVNFVALAQTWVWSQD